MKNVPSVIPPKIDAGLNIGDMDMNRISRTLAGVGTALYACSPFLDVAADTMGDAYIDVRQQVGRVFALQVKTPPFPEFRL